MRKGRKGLASQSSSNWSMSTGMFYQKDASISSFDRNPHRPRRPCNDASRVVFVEGVEVFDLFLRDRLALGHRDLADLVLVRFAAALLGLDGVLQQDAGGRA